MANSVTRTQCSALPKGWIREEVPRLSNNIHGAAGKVDVFYLSPSGVKIRSKQELTKALGDHYDMSAFDYMTGKINPLLLRTKPTANTEGNKRKSTPNGNRYPKLINVSMKLLCPNFLRFPFIRSFKPF